MALFNAIAAYASNIENFTGVAAGGENRAKHTSFRLSPEQYNIVGTSAGDAGRNVESGRGSAGRVGQAYGVLANVFYSSGSRDLSRERQQKTAAAQKARAPSASLRKPRGQHWMIVVRWRNRPRRSGRLAEARFCASGDPPIFTDP